jgi:uncharacterized protein (DUF1778 family)
MAGTPARTRSNRIEVRTTNAERALIDRAARVVGTDLTTFVVGNVMDAARRVLADREAFVLSNRAQAEWEKINRRPARDLPGLRELMRRRSPFVK